jgi:phosphopantetheinyl transferase
MQIHFHDKVIPNKYVLMQARKAVIKSQGDGLTDPPSDTALFQFKQLG